MPTSRRSSATAAPSSLDTDRVNFQKEGFSKKRCSRACAGAAEERLAVRRADPAACQRSAAKFVLQGGTQHNLAAVKAQVDLHQDRVPGCEVFVHPHTGEAGAIGAAMENPARRQAAWQSSTFIGLDAAIDLKFTSKNDEETRLPTSAPTTALARSSIPRRRTATPAATSLRLLVRKGTVESKKRCSS